VKKGDVVIGKVRSVAFPNKGIAEVCMPAEKTGNADGVLKSTDAVLEAGDAVSVNTCVDDEKTDGGKANTVSVKVRVKGVLPGQTVKMRIKKMHHGSPEGILLDVVEPASVEVPSDCPHFDICGGCSYRTLPYEEQLRLKEEQVINLLKPVVEGKTVSDFSAKDSETGSGICFDDIYEGINPSPEQYGYRNKMEFSFGDEYKDGPLSLGLHKRGSMYDIVPVTDCRIVDEDYRAILKFTLEFFKERNIPYFHKTQHTGYLRHLLVRKSKKYGEILVALITRGMNPGDGVSDPFSDKLSMGFDEKALLSDYAAGLQNLSLSGILVGIVHTVNDSVADVVKDDGSEVLFGRSYIREELLGLEFKISQFSFFQTNSLGAEVLYGKVREFLFGQDTITGNEDLSKPDLIYDLYSGTGTIAQLLAPVAKKVVGVEIVEEAVEAAKENAARNGLKNCDFIAGDVLKVLDDLAEKPEFIILDPPRDGIHPKALPKILSYGVEKMVYVSCKPTSLARDLEIFMANEYFPRRICTVDMFPGTGHVETVVLLSQQKPDDHIEIEIDLDEIDATRAETKATYEEIRNWVQEMYGFHVTNLNIAQVKQKHGIIERENYNKPKSENSKQPGCPEEKVKAIEDALRYFQMI